MQGKRKPCGSYEKPRANGRNIVGQQRSTLSDVTCCVRLYTLLCVAAQSLKTVKLLDTCKRTLRLPTMLLAKNVASICTRLKGTKVSHRWEGG